jgi:hypothetical protein
MDGLLERARQKGIVLWVVNDTLHFRAPTGALDDGLRRDIANHKAELVESLSGPRFVAGEPEATSPTLEYNRGLWAQMADGTLTETFTNAPHCMCVVEGPLDLETVRDAVAALVAQHRILGARVVMSADGCPYFHYGHPVDIRWVDLSDIGALRRRRIKNQALHNIVWTPFDVASETMFRPFMVKLSANRHIVGFVLNHFAGDAWSVNVLAGELLRRFSGATTGVPPRRALQYADYIREINRWMRGPGMRNRVKWWKQQLRGARSSLLTPDFQVDLDTQGHYKEPHFSMTRRQLTTLRDRASSSGVTLFALLLAANALALSRLCSLDDVVILTVFHGRTDEALFDLVGSVQMHVPIRIRIEPGMTFAALARSALEATTLAYAHFVPYGWIRAEFEEIGASGRFAELNFVGRQTALDSPAEKAAASLRFEPIALKTSPPLPVSTPRHVVSHSLSFTEQGSLIGKLGYLDCVYSEGTIQRFLAMFFRILDFAASDPDQEISSWQLTKP